LHGGDASGIFVLKIDISSLIYSS